MKNEKLQWLTKNAILAALYVALTLVFAPISYGAIQFRVAELLVMIPFFNKKWIPGIVIGCLIANMFSPLGIVDVVFGTLATLIGGIIVAHMKNIWLATLAPSIVNGLIVGTQLFVMFKAPLIASMIYVFIGELVVVLISVIVLNTLKNNKAVEEILVG